MKIKKGLKNIQTAGYNGARTVYDLEMVGEWVMKWQPFWIKILHIFPILLSRFGDKKIETCYLCCVDICKGKFTMCLFTSDTAAFGGGWNVGQSKAHIDLAASIPFPSINPTNPRTNAWNFGGNCSAFGSGWKTQLFWVGHLKNLFCITKNFLLHSHEN